MNEDEIRTDERRRLAGLLRESAPTLAGYAATKDALVLLIALMLDMGAPTAPPAASGADRGAS